MSLLGACATLAPDTYGLDQAGASAVNSTCNRVMGLRRGFAEYDACGESLADAYRREVDAQKVSLAHADCKKQGHAPGSPALARCVLNESRGAKLTPNPAPVADDPRVAQVSFFSMDRRTQAQREELACAQLGIDPASGQFRECVLELKEAIFAIQNPL